MKFKKKPVVIEAERWDMENPIDGVYCAVDSLENVDPVQCRVVKPGQKLGHFYIDTLEGFHEVSLGDWIITGVKGEKYPCKPDIFAATYEEVKPRAAEHDDHEHTADCDHSLTIEIIETFMEHVHEGFVDLPPGARGVVVLLAGSVNACVRWKRETDEITPAEDKMILLESLESVQFNLDEVEAKSQ